MKLFGKENVISKAVFKMIKISILLKGSPLGFKSLLFEEKGAENFHLESIFLFIACTVLMQFISLLKQSF